MAVGDADAHHTAMCVVAMGKSRHFPPRAVQHLSAATSKAKLVPAAKGAWHSCPDLHEPTLRLQLNGLLTLVSQRYGAASSFAACPPALQAIPSPRPRSPRTPQRSWLVPPGLVSPSGALPSYRRHPPLGRFGRPNRPQPTPPPLFLGGLGLVSPGAGARWQGGGVEWRDRWVPRLAVVPLALNGERSTVKVLNGAGG